MKTYTLILLGLLLAGCTGQGIQFTDDDSWNLNDRPSAGDRDISSEDDTINWLINARGANESQSDCEQCSKVDLHFYFGAVGKSAWNSLFNTFSNCLNKFARNTYTKGFLSHLQNLNWQFSYSLFSAGSNQPNFLEFDGRHVNPPHRSHKRKSYAQKILTQRFEYYEDIFSYTITPFTGGGDSFYSAHHANARGARTIRYDAPFEHSTARNKGGSQDPLAGLSDLLDNRYGAIREGSRVEIFVVTNYFPDYSEEELQSFISKYQGVRIHLLSSHPQSSFLGGLIDLTEQTGGAAKHFCKNKNIGPELAEIVKHK